MSNASACPSLRGKTVAVFTRNRANTPIILSGCFFESRESRLFLVGNGTPPQRATQEWTDGVRRAVAWDAVDEYLVFDSPEDYYARTHAAAQPAEPAAESIATLPMFASPQGPEGYPVEPSGVPYEPETPLTVGSIVLSYSQGRWWRAEVVAIEGDDMVRIHYPGWDSTWDVTLPKTELQVDLSGSLDVEEAEDN